MSTNFETINLKADILKDKVAIITGSSGGIGKATAIELAQKGAIVVLNGRNQSKLDNADKELREMGAKVLSICADITDAKQARDLIDKTISTFGKLDILINNAGISMRGNFSDLSPKVFETVFNINVQGSVNTSIPAMQHLKSSNGSLVFVSSAAGIRGLPLLSAYSSSKMALRALAESIRIEEASANIHVGLIYVGITEVEHNKQTMVADGSYIALKSRPGAQSTEQVAKAILKNIRRRKFITTLSTLGKISLIMQWISPILVEKILIYSSKKIQNLSE